MFALTPILLAVIAGIGLVIFKITKGLRTFRYFKWVLAVGLLAGILSMAISLKGAQYVANYQTQNNTCPGVNPYEMIVIAAGAIGLAAFISGAVVAFKNRQMNAGVLMIICLAFSLFLSFADLIVSALCFTF